MAGEPGGPVTRRRILVATGDVVRAQMAGPAIRAWQIATALAADHDVHLVSSLSCDLPGDGFATSFVDGPRFDELLDWCDIVVFQGHLMRQFPSMLHSDKIVVADVYDPFHLEVLEQTRDLPFVERQRVLEDCVSVLNEQLARADFLLCASEKQRDFWFGQLAAVGRINPATYDVDESLDSLLAVVPFGVPDSPPVQARHALKGAVPGIGADDLVVLWGGGIYNWFDPLTLLHAVDALKARIPTLRLVFLGMRHPNPHVGEMRMAVETRELAGRLGLTGKHVFFNEDWVAYDDRQNYLLDADVGVSTHLDHIETAFSFRTRILDYLWAGLPIVCTGGDSLAALVERHGLGATAGPGDLAGLTDALGRVLDDASVRAGCRRAIAEVVPDFRWARVLEPLVRFCADPQRAADLVDGRVRKALVPEPPRPRTWRDDVRAVTRRLRSGQVRDLARQARARLSADRTLR